MKRMPPASSGARAPAVKSVLVIMAIALCFPTGSRAQECQFYRTDLTGAEVVPPTQSPAYAHYDSWFDLCCFPCADCGNLSGGYYYAVWIDLDRYWPPLQGNPQTIRIHQGARGENGPLIREFPVSAFPVEYQFDFDPAYCQALEDTLTYVVITTDRYPDGEIRGQLAPVAIIATAETSWGRIRSLFR